MLKHSKITMGVLSAGIAASLMGMPLAAQAGTTMGSGKEMKQTYVEKEKESFISGDFGFTWTTAYLSRGVVQEDSGFIGQPFVDLYIKMYEGDGFVNKIQLNLGLWASLHSAKTGASQGTRLGAFYEFDWLPGIAVTFAKNFTFTVSWYEFDFISSGGRSGNLNMNLGYDDTDLLGALALHPHVAVLKGFIGNPSGLPGADNSWYYEAGIAPGFPIGPVSVTLPVTAGFGDAFYNGDAFGYVSAGASLSVPLAFIPEGYGTWTATASGLYYYMNDEPAAFNRGQNNKGVASAGFVCAF
jgi:hypothetical protein